MQNTSNPGWLAAKNIFFHFFHFFHPLENCRVQTIYFYILHNVVVGVGTGGAVTFKKGNQTRSSFDHAQASRKYRTMKTWIKKKSPNLDLDPNSDIDPDPDLKPDPLNQYLNLNLVFILILNLNLNQILNWKPESDSKPEPEHKREPESESDTEREHDLNPVSEP